MASNSNPPQPSEFPQIPRRKAQQDESLQFLWAVSYSDLLMVLMSFFIVFFDSSGENSKSQYKLILQSISGATGKTGAARIPADAGTAPTPSKTIASSSSSATETIGALAEAFDKNNVHFLKSEKSNQIEIDFPDNFYEPGQYLVSEKAKERIESVLNLIKSHKEVTALTFIGHTDAAPIKALLNKNKIIDSNMILSNLRAARAAEIAVVQGFNPKHVVAQGNGEFSRKMRSVTLRISILEKP